MKRTVPKPFNLSSGNKRTYDQANAQTKPAIFQPSMGEAVIDFAKQMRKPVAKPGMWCYFCGVIKIGER